MNTAVGAGAVATGANSAAFGAGAQATHANASAFGPGAQTTRDDQQVLGTAANTYTMPGLTSGASKAAQGAPTHIVTSNPGGDLAHTIGELGLATTGDLAVLNNQLQRTTEGVALAMAMAGSPTLLPTENIAVTANWGTFDGAHGLAGAFALRLDRNVQFNAGVAFGVNESTVGGAPAFASAGEGDVGLFRPRRRGLSMLGQAHRAVLPRAPASPLYGCRASDGRMP